MMLYTILFKKKNDFHQDYTILNDFNYHYRLDFKIPRKGWMDTDDEEYVCLMFNVDTNRISHLLTEAMEFWFSFFQDCLHDHILMDEQSHYHSILEWSRKTLVKDNKKLTHASFLKMYFGILLSLLFHLESLLTLNKNLVEHKVEKGLYYKTWKKTHQKNQDPSTPPHSPEKHLDDCLVPFQYLADHHIHYHPKDSQPNKSKNSLNSIVVNVCQVFLHPMLNGTWEVITCHQFDKSNPFESIRSQEELLYLLLYYIKATHLRPYQVTLSRKPTLQEHTTV